MLNLHDQILIAILSFATALDLIITTAFISLSKKVHSEDKTILCVLIAIIYYTGMTLVESIVTLGMYDPYPSNMYISISYIPIRCIIALIFFQCCSPINYKKKLKLELNDHRLDTRGHIHCPGCQYDLRASLYVKKCPECGYVLDWDDLLNLKIFDWQAFNRKALPVILLTLVWPAIAYLMMYIAWPKYYYQINIYEHFEQHGTHFNNITYRDLLVTRTSDRRAKWFNVAPGPVHHVTCQMSSTLKRDFRVCYTVRLDIDLDKDTYQIHELEAKSTYSRYGRLDSNFFASIDALNVTSSRSKTLIDYIYTGNPLVTWTWNSGRPYKKLHKSLHKTFKPAFLTLVVIGDIIFLWLINRKNGTRLQTAQK